MDRRLGHKDWDYIIEDTLNLWVVNNSEGEQDWDTTRELLKKNVFTTLLKSG